MTEELIDAYAIIADVKDIDYTASKTNKYSTTQKTRIHPALREISPKTIEAIMKVKFTEEESRSLASIPGPFF